MADILIEHGTVITLNGQRRIIEDGAVAIRGDRIVAVDSHAALATAGPFETKIDARRMVVLPGLVDCHAHAGHGLVKTLGADDGDAWSRACEAFYMHASSEDFWAAEAALAALERLKFGVTCGVSLFGGGDSILRTDEPVYADRHCESVREVGIRTFLAVGPCRPPFPRRFVRWNGDATETLAVSFEQQLATCDTIVKRWHGADAGRINICIVSPTLRREHLDNADATAVTLAELQEQAQAARALSRRHGILFTQDGHTRGSVAYAHDPLNILGPDALLSHSTDLTDEEIRIIAETDTRVVHNPSAIASIRGRCPVPELLDAGANVVLGSDATAPDRSGDMFRHMQQCMHYHRRHFRDPDVLPPGKVLEMVTIDAARALGLDAEIGSIEVGKKADLILVDLFKPHTYPLQMPLYRTVYYANGNDVDTVIVDGRILMRGREVLSVNESAVLEDAQREADLALERSGLTGLTEPRPRLWGHSHY
jgi:cytosine/adenosine deaminase-related metal-dependent hydrolase